MNFHSVYKHLRWGQFRGQFAYRYFSFFFYYNVSADELDSPKAVRIVNPVNHTFHLELDELKSILENDKIKDRNVVIVSIAGAYRQGKSFMLNFFVKYLNAQYKSHDVSDWIGENERNSQVDGFKFRGGRKPETIGIWLWSEVFTHDFENGEKVAILLIDTQGIFDSKSSVRDCTTIFALSMMLSSVQCYNLMQNIREDDLQHLELFTEYGRLALQHSNEKPFQKLLFIVRDWPYAFETAYGWDGHKVIDDFLYENEDQTPEMRVLRTHIKVSFEHIQGFLMPHPGFTVAQGANFTGNLREVSLDFIKHIKELVPGLFAPGNLIVKKINGEKVRARDLIKYLETYTNIFNGDTLPEPKTVLMATAEASYQILITDCLNHYVDSMQKYTNEVEYLSEAGLMELHNNIKRDTLAQFLARLRFGGEELASTFHSKIESNTEDKFLLFKAENERKRENFIQKANLHNEIKIGEIYEATKKKIQSDIQNSNSDLKISDLSNVSNIAKQVALEEFNRSKMGDADISNSFREKLDHNLNNFNTALLEMLQKFNERQNHYTNSMQSSLDHVEYFRPDDFMGLHQRIKNEAMSQFLEFAQLQVGEIKFIIQQKLEQNIEEKHRIFEERNVAKRTNFVTGGELVRAEAVAFRWPSVTVSCPPGKKMISGGGNCKSHGSNKGWCFLYESRPISVNEFRVRCDTPEKQNVMAEAYVICK